MIMEPFLMLGIFAVPIAITLIVMVGLIVLSRVSGRRNKGGVNDEQALALNKAWTMLNRMEARIENLETILLEKQRDTNKFGDGR